LGKVLEEKKKANWLLYGLVGISLLLHAGILLHLSRGMAFRKASCIEISLESESRPRVRNIPKPRLDRAMPPSSPLIQPRMLQEASVPDPVPPVSELQPPDVFDAPPHVPVRVHAFSPPEPLADAKTDAPVNIGDEGESESRMDYLGMVRLRIETRKKYPALALSRNLEGRAVVDFVIEPDGRVTRTSVVQTSGHPLLDDAALDAVHRAAPFPPPPQKIFNAGVQVSIPIIFELIQ